MKDDISDETLQAIKRVTLGRRGNGNLDKIADHLIDTRAQLAEVTKQRDAAFEWRKEQFGLAIQQRDEAMEELAEMTAQRDEALEELADVTKQRDQLADLLGKAKIYVHTCPLQAQIIAALAAKKGGGR